jgi:NTP pyrophosphatase (non-canonical NTP hydrolase)
MSDEEHMVTEFYRAFGIAIGTSPAMPDEVTCALRIRLIKQELDELQEAFAHQDVVVVAKELADLLYVVYGTAISCGIDMAPVLQEVHRSNMSQVGVYQRADGTWIGPVGYTPPRLQPILVAQGRIEHDDTTVHTQQKNGDGAVYTTTLQAGTLGPVLIDKLQAMRGILPLSSGYRLPHSVHMDRREDSTSMREALSVQCPRCGKSFVRRSHRQGLKERLLSLVYIYPFRCQVCANRFRAFQFRVVYTKRTLDRRQYARLPTQLPTIFAEAVKRGEQRVGQGVVTAISLGGCYLQTGVPLRGSTLVSLELQTEQNTPAIVVEAAIVRVVQPAGVGLEFLRLSEPEQERLNQFIHQLLTIQRATQHEVESR